MAGLRNEPVDRRYLSDQDKQDYNQGGGYGERASAKARAQSRRGNISYNANRPQRTTISKAQGKAGGRSSFGGFADFTRYGDEAQRERMSEISKDQKRAEGFKPTKMTLPDIYQ